MAIFNGSILQTPMNWCKLNIPIPAIEVLRNMYARFGVPKFFVFEVATSFCLDEFQTLLSLNKIEYVLHITLSQM